MESGNGAPDSGSRRKGLLSVLLVLLVDAAILASLWLAGPLRNLVSPQMRLAGARLSSGELAHTGTPAAPAATPTPSPTSTATVAPAATATPRTAAMPVRATPSVVRAKIEIVWPHDGASVRDASLANITAYLITGSGVGSSTALDAPPCDWEPTVRLWAALNNESARHIAVGRKRLLAAGGRRYPVWDFNDIDVSATRDPSNKLTFFVTVDGVRTLHSVWAHASDARTLFPQPDMPTGVVTRLPQTVDARIEIVWPHDGLAVADASLANITAYLFVAGTLDSISPSVARLAAVRLHWALNNEPEREGSSLLGRPRVVTAGTGVEFMAWDFNDVDISAARDPLNRLYFWVSVDGVETRSNIWAHGVDARTIFPQPDVLNSCR